MRNNSEQSSKEFWLDLQHQVNDLLQYADPDKHLEILENLYDAYIDSDFANDLEERRAISEEYRIFKNILKTMRKHAICLPKDLPALPVTA